MRWVKLYKQDIGEGALLCHLFVREEREEDIWRLHSLHVYQPKRRRTDRDDARRIPSYSDPDVLLWVGDIELYVRAMESSLIPPASLLLGTFHPLVGPVGLIRVLSFEAKLAVALSQSEGEK